MKLLIFVQYLIFIQLSIQLNKQCTREEIDKLICLPTQNIIFFRKCSITQEIAISKLNILANECNYPWQIQNFKQINIQANSTLLKIHENKAITNKEINFNQFFKSQYQMQHSKYSLPNYKEAQNLRQLISLFYHLINYNTSFYKYDLLSLPKTPENLLFYLTPAEQEIIKSIPLGQEVLQFKQYAKQAYLYFMEGITKHYTKEQVMSMFRGEFLNYDSFLYLCFLQSTQSIIKSNKNNDHVIMFPPFFHFNQQENNFNQNQLINFKKQSSFISQQNILENQEISYQFKQMTNINYVLQYNQVPEQNEFNCINIMLFESQQKESLPPIYCLNLKSIQIYEAYFYMKAMDRKSLEQCLGDKLFNFNLLEQYKMILNQCEKPENTGQFWKFPLENIKKLKKEYLKVIKQLSQKIDDNSYSNAKLILKFCYKELKLIKKLIQHISEKYFN